MKLNGNLNSLAPVVASVAASLLKPSSGKGPVPVPGGGDITVSPSFQQAFTPQFSPVMQQQQDAPGATQTAAPTQYATGGQTAVTGEGMPPIPMPSPGLPSYLPTGEPEYQPTFQSQTPGQYQQLLTIGIIAAAAIMIANMYKGKRTPARSSARKSTAQAVRKTKPRRKRTP